jgi:hypothetical protein
MLFSASTYFANYVGSWQIHIYWSQALWESSKWLLLPRSVGWSLSLNTFFTV